MDEYIRISKTALLRKRHNLTRDIYFLRKSSPFGREYGLFARGNDQNNSFQKISSAPLNWFFIKVEESPEYYRFLEDNLSGIVCDADMADEEKVQLIYDRAIEILQDIFCDPTSEKDIRRIEEIVRAIVSFTLLEPSAPKLLLDTAHKDYYTFSHCLHVSVFSVGLATVFGIKDKKDLYELGLGAIFADIGKLMVDPKIINKPGKLTPEEFEEIKQHTVHGYDLMKNFLPKRSLDIILHHHEKFNGTGYPDGLSKSRISLFSKITSIADVYDALTTNRSYAKASSPFKAILTMKQEMIGHFEEDKFIAFIKMLSPQKKSKTTPAQ